jgi:hypothetical protein
MIVASPPVSTIALFGILPLPILDKVDDASGEDVTDAALNRCGCVATPAIGELGIGFG